LGIQDNARLALAYGMSLLSYWAHGSPHPFSASFAVTNRCNLRCSYCNTPFLDPRDLPLDQVKMLFRRLRGMGVIRLGLLGGEPLVRKDIGQMLAMGKDLGFYVSLNTNLVLYERMPAIFDSVDLVLTSLDGDAETHRKNRGARSYDGVLEAIEALVGRGKPVVAIAVVTEHNLDQPEILLRQAEELGFKLHFQPQCTNTAIVRGDIPEDLTDTKLRQFWADLLEQKKAGRPIASSAAYLAVQSRWQSFRVSSYQDPTTRCAAGHGFLYIDPQGNAYPCAYTKRKAKPINLLEEDWRSAFPGTTPCTRCNVGPMLEFNLLFEKPVSASLGAFQQIT
jgi:MoaA/NifB/PqqE/SkfB family radical SAM enzyme